jgi:hypothetical protein
VDLTHFLALLQVLRTQLRLTILSGFSNSTGSANAFFGFSAGTANTTGGGNSFFGFNAGASNTTATSNSFFGSAAGNLTTAGSNSFFGFAAGTVNVSGTANSFFGNLAGTANTAGSFNSFFGSNAGAANTTAINNAFFGQGAGFKNTTGGNNTFLGNGAGLNNVASGGNTFVGSLAGQGNSSGTLNTFVGVNAGTANVGSSNNTFIGANAANTNLTGSGNTYIGSGTDGATIITNSTAIGLNAFAGQSNSVILGSINGVNGAAADTSIGIGITQPAAKVHIKDSSSSNTTLLIEGSAAAGTGIEINNTPSSTGDWLIFADGGINSCCTLHFVNKNPIIAGEVFAINAAKTATAGNGNVNVNGDFTVAGVINFGVLGNNGNTNLCRNAAGYLATCSSSLRYKKDLQPYTSGMSLINKLNPITFRWKQDNMLDLGFGAEDVEKVEPLLVTHNAQGQVEGLKYDRITALLVNAMKEQQTQITEKQTQITHQQEQMQNMQQQLSALKALVCADHPNADVCK